MLLENRRRIQVQSLAILQEPFFGQIRLTEVFKTFHISETGQSPGQNPTLQATPNQYLLFMGTLHLTSLPLVSPQTPPADRVSPAFSSTLSYPAPAIQILVGISRSTPGTKKIALLLLYKLMTLNLESGSAASLQQPFCKLK